MTQLAKPRFQVGDPVRIDPKAVSLLQLKELLPNLSDKAVRTIYPPQSYTGTVMSYHGPNPKSYIVKWDHLGDDGFLFFENELRPGS